MKTYLIKPGIRQAIAKAGETDVAVAFDGRAWKTEYPAGRPQLLVTAPGGRQTPVTVTEEGGMIEGQVPAELLSAPGAYVYQFVWTQGTTQQASNVCDVIILASQLADTWANRRHTPEWAERIFLAAEVIEGAMDGTLEARHTALSAAESAAGSRDAAAASAESAAEDAESAAEDAQAAAAKLAEVNEAGAAQTAAIQLKGETTLASIPEDYTALSNQVDDLDSAVHQAAGDLCGNTMYPATYPGHMLETSNGVIDIANPVEAPSFDVWDIPCSAGEVFSVYTEGGTSAYAWAFVNADGTVLTRSASGVTMSGTQITAPENAAHLVVNDKSSTGRVYAGKQLAARVKAIEDTGVATFDGQIKSRRYNAIFYAAEGADIVYSGLDVSTPSYHTGTKNLIIRMGGTTYNVTPQMIINAATDAGVDVDENGVITKGSFAIYLDETDGSVHCTINAGTTQDVLTALSKHPVIFAAHYASFRSGLAVDYMTARRAEKIPGLLEVTPTVPAYFEENLAEKIPLIIANMNEAGANGTTFVFITDLHWETNYKNSPALVRRVLSKTNVKNVFCGGDLFNQGEKDAMAEVLLDCVNHFRFVQTNGFFPVARGNHDDNSNWSSSADLTAHVYDANTIYSLLLSPVADRVTRIGNNWTFYFDQAEIKTRYIFVDTKRNGLTIDKDQIISCLNSVASGWHVVIVMHFTLNSAAALFAGCDLIAHIVSAYNNRESGSYSGSQQTATYDFTAAAGTVDLIIGGHKHADLAMGADDPNNPSGVPIIATDTDSYRNHDGTGGTVDSQCFDVVTVNYSAKTVKCVRIGRGSDREYSYGS
jgi:predicted phosphodiesterase